MEKLRSVVENIFNNWTALQLAVEHSMGGPSSKEIALHTIDYLTNYCISEIGSIEVADIEDVLVDVMDEEFQTICEDNSPQEIAHVIYKFLQLVKSGDLTQFEVEFNNLPTSNLWLSKQAAMPSQTVKNDVVPLNSTNEVPSTSAPMDEDQEWTEVKTRRKK